MTVKEQVIECSLEKGIKIINDRHYLPYITEY